MASDTTEERREKIKIINENFDALEKAKESVADELVYLLDLFDGKLSLSDILNYEIPLLEALKQAKTRSIQSRNEKKK